MAFTSCLVFVNAVTTVCNPLAEDGAGHFARQDSIAVRTMSAASPTSKMRVLQGSLRQWTEPSVSVASLRAAFRARHPPHRDLIGNLLLAAGCADEVAIARALAAQDEHPGVRLGELLLAAHAVHEDELYRALGEQMGVPFVRLGEFDVDAATLDALPHDIARRRRVLPLMVHEGKLVVATDDPADTDKMSALGFRASLPVEAVLASPGDLDSAIATHYPAIEDEALESARDQLRLQRTESDTSSPETMAQAKPIVRLVENLLQNAVQRRASDIHLHPRERSADVRYRIDGSLVGVGEFNRALLPAVVARIKVLSSMDLAEHRLPQDGAIHLKTPNGAVDMRVSVMPALHGEDVVIRILDPRVGLRRLADIGFTPADERRFRALIDRNQGLVLVTGPTGSGKTTTLYAALQELNNGEYNIVTVEDPVEYRLDGVAQMQVHQSIGFGFAQALRNILRHDPDIILIGEVRDADTAKIAVESSLTGHLVLSTLHTNSAAQTVTRLVEIGIQPYLVNATLAGVLAQRLVRRNCVHCKAAEQVSSDVREALGVGAAEEFWRGSGCAECSGTGFHGRVAVYELLEMTPEIRRLVSAGAGHDLIEARATEEGMVRLTVQALSLARAGIISLAEVFRARLE
jgi:type IV pilus assembly protein PilB